MLKCYKNYGLIGLCDQKELETIPCFVKEQCASLDIEPAIKRIDFMDILTRHLARIEGQIDGEGSGKEQFLAGAMITTQAGKNYVTGIINRIRGRLETMQHELMIKVRDEAISSYAE